MRRWTCADSTLHVPLSTCQIEVFSKPHFGGDGFGFWVLAGEQDPSFAQNVDALSGPLFGLKQDYKGFGVVVDVVSSHATAERDGWRAAARRLREGGRMAPPGGGCGARAHVLC